MVVILILTLLTVLTFSGCNENSENDLADSDNGVFFGNVVAIVNGEEITSEEVTILQQSYMQQGQQLSEKEALDQIIDQKLLNQQALQDEYMPTTEEAEIEIETLLQQQGMTLDDYKQQLAQQGMNYEESLQNFKEDLAIQNYVEAALKEREFEGLRDEAESELESMLQLYNMSKDELTQQLAQMGMTYEDFLQDIKKDIAQEYLIEELRTQAEIEYLI
ncbi:MAG: SurA N-terminal domain-containing protein [Candidatus Thermoplasmatota archaeon]|nr:SurA N-terminal domain-containing protein [Candidatus Thermoplasmatota archaeon]